VHVGSVPPPFSNASTQGQLDLSPEAVPAEHLSEFDLEQRYLTEAYACLEQMRASARAITSNVISEAGGTHQARFERDVLEERAAERLVRLQLGTESLIFGRIDRTDGEQFHIGRLPITDAEQNPIVVDWRAPVSESFYRATGRNPLGLVRRRHITTEQDVLLGIDDEVFSVDLLESGDSTLVGSGALLAALGRARGAHMRDIVGTIQIEQDEIIRDEMHGVLIVQGGPGTGKTAVALHRASYLLYAHRFPLERQGVLVVGPNRTFMRYISRVLPSLGDTGVALSAVDDLVTGINVVALDPYDVARVKGDLRMATVIRRAVTTRERGLKDPITVPYGITELRISPQESSDVVHSVKKGNRQHNGARKQFVNAFVEKLWLKYREALGRSGRLRDDGSGGVQHQDFAAAMRSEPIVRQAIDRMWPLLTPEVLLRDLFGATALIRAASRDVLTESEQKSLERPRGDSIDAVPWTSGDVPLLDEAATHLGPLPSTAHVLHDEPGHKDVVVEESVRTYGHIVIDEAQDLSPMQLRMLTRRSLSGSMTVVGDIGQATGMWAPNTWDDVAKHLPTKKPARHAELTVGYRTPSEIMAVAARVLEVAAPQLSVPKSVRSVGYGPTLVSGSAGDNIAPLVLRAVEGIMRTVDDGTVGVLVPDSLIVPVQAELEAAGLDLDNGDGNSSLSVISVRLVKGLEFDGVVVVEPARIVAEAPQGLRSLFVTLTRPTKALSIVHVEPLPDCLSTGD
jgi:DNA helicase IV